MATTSKSISQPAGAFRTGGVTASSPIDWNTALQMMNAYRQNCNHLYTYYQKEGSTCTHKAILQGFRVSVTALQSLIDGELTDGKHPDEIFISFGVAPECLDANPEDQGFTVILCGIKNVTGSSCGNIITTGDTPALEYCLPCPDTCPINLAEELNVYPGSLPCCDDCINNSNCQDCQDDIPKKE